MREILLYAGEKVIIDDEDVNLISRYKWYKDKRGYAKTGIYLGNYKTKYILMHRLINNTPEGYDTDHINGNTLDNRKCNLRTASRSLNMHNYSKLNNKGAYKYGTKGKWRSEITINYKRKNLGVFNSKEEALMAHHKALGEVTYS